MAGPNRLLTLILAYEEIVSDKVGNFSIFIEEESIKNQRQWNFEAFEKNSILVCDLVYPVTNNIVSKPVLHKFDRTSKLLVRLNDFEVSLNCSFIKYPIEDVCSTNMGFNFNFVCLKQAIRQWNEKFKTALIEFDFVQSSHYYSLFTYNHDNVFFSLLMYVDDIIVTSDNENMVSKVKKYLDNKFKIKDLGILQYFLCIEVVRDNETLCLCQRLC